MITRYTNPDTTFHIVLTLSSPQVGDTAVPRVSVFPGAGDTLSTLLGPFTDAWFKVYSNDISNVTNNLTAAMSRNNSVNSLMGFSVHQPTIGSPLQFFPAMGSKQLDEMIDAYIPGDASIPEKRAAVSMEFFEYAMATGDLFKFFMVYPTLGSTNTSPTMDSGYHSSFTTSPAMSENQWNSTSSRVVSPSSAKKATASNDFSNLPGMKIMTKDGQDVTNSASRGCKTKEQRDHAHLMRIIKACDSCRRKKTKCDPSHKRPAAGTSSGKITKKASRNPRPAAAPPQIATKQASMSTEFDQIFSASSSSLNPFAESLNVPTDGFSMEWDQFIQYDEEPTEAIPYDYDFFLDPAGFFSPATTASFSSSSTSPSQLPITPIDRDINITDNTTEGHDHWPILPYLNPGGVEPGSNYVDFNLYSPQSSFLDEDLELMKEVTASPIQSQRRDRHRQKRTDTRQEAANNGAAFRLISDNAACDETTYRQNAISDAVGDGIFHGISNHMNQWSDSMAVANVAGDGRAHDSQHANFTCDRQARSSPLAMVTGPGTSLLDTVTSDGHFGREALYEQASSRPLSDRGRLQSPIVLDTAEYGTEEHCAERQRGDQPGAEGGISLHSSATAVRSVTRIGSPSPQPYIDRSRGRDGPSRIESRVNAAIESSLPTQVLLEKVRSSPLSPLGFELNVSQDNRHCIHCTTTAHTPAWQVPQSSESLSPSPIAMRPSTSKMNSQAILKPRRVSIDAIYHLGKQDRGLAVPRNSGRELQYPTGARQSFPALTNQLALPGTLPTIPMITGLGVISLAVSLSSFHSTLTRSNGLIKSVQPVVLGAGAVTGARYMTAVLLFCIALFVLSPLVSFLPMGALPIFTGCIQLEQTTSSPSTNRQSSNLSPSHMFPDIRRLHIHITNGFKARYSKIVHVVRCDLAKRSMPEAHPRTSSTTEFSRPEPPRRLQRWAVTPLV